MKVQLKKESEEEIEMIIAKLGEESNKQKQEMRLKIEHEKKQTVKQVEQLKQELKDRENDLQTIRALQQQIQGTVALCMIIISFFSFSFLSYVC